MTQYKQRLFNRELSENQRELALQSSERSNREFLLKLPQNVPDSRIVYGEESNSIRDIAVKIYMKYVKSGAVHEINVEWQTRNGLSNLIENDEWELNEEHDDLVNL